MGHRTAPIKETIANLFEIGVLSFDASVDDVCSTIHITRRTLSRMFAREGISFKKFVHERRVILATKLLRTTNASIEDIAKECKLISRRSLSKIFVAELGVSPSTYREAYRNKNVYSTL